MSFLKITEGDFVVNEFLKTRQNFQQNFLSERVGDVNAQYELSKLFSPVTNMQKVLKEGLVCELKLIREGMKDLPRAIIFAQYPSIKAYDDDGEEKEYVFIGDIAEQYLHKFASASSTAKTFGLRDKDGKFYIGNMEAKIKEHNVNVRDKEYAGTPGLWELLVATTPDGKKFHQWRL